MSNAKLYLQERGITPATIEENGLELCTYVQPGEFHRRLGFNKPDVLDELIWIPHRDANGTIRSWTARLFPPRAGNNGDKPAKFLTPKDGDSYPWIAAATWHVAQKLKHPLLITEGVPKALAALQAGAHPISISGVWQAGVKDESGETLLHPAFNDFAFNSRKVYLAFDADFRTNPDVRQALIRTAVLLHKQGADVKILTWPLASGKGLDDYLINMATDTRPAAEVLASLYEKASDLAEVIEESDLHFVRVEIKRAQLSGSALSQICHRLFKKLGVRQSALEDECKPTDEPGGVRALDIPDVEPWPDRVNGSDLLEELRIVVRRHVCLKKSQAIAVALWILLTHAEPYIDCAPILAITSPQKQCGKTTLIDDILKLLVRKPLGTVSITAAALFRSIEKWSPTVLIDEADSFLKDNEDLRGVLNSGNKRGGYSIRSNPVTLEPECFPTWGPKAIACIGKLPDTLADRSIHIELQRRGKDDPITKLRDVNPEEFIRMKRQACRWASDNGDLIKAARPKLPNVLYNRAGDNWFPLLAIADVVSPEWGREAASVAISLNAETSDESFSTQLLIGLQRIVQANPDDTFFTTTEILTGLNSDKEAPWSDWNDGKGLTPHKLAKELKRYPLKSVQQRHDGGNPQCGYLVDKLNEVFVRYLVTP